MDYYSTTDSATTWPECTFDDVDVQATSGTAPRGLHVVRVLKRRPRDVDSRAFSISIDERASMQATSNGGALPGELLTEEVSGNLDGRRVLKRVFRKLAVGESIAPGTVTSLDGFLDALPRAKHLPTVSPDGDGGLTLAWAVPGHGRTLVTVADGVLYVVGNAGTPHAQYLPDIDCTDTLSDDLLALIPE